MVGMAGVVDLAVGVLVVLEDFDGLGAEEVAGDGDVAALQIGGPVGGFVAFVEADGAGVFVAGGAD